MKSTHITIDGNEAAAHVAFRTNEVIAIYPITPSSPMGELSDEWAAFGKKNIWGTSPHVVEMQSEGGASAAVHGAVQTGALTTTFTSSQGFLLMIPTLFKIAGELTPTVFHIAARTVASHALSIFGDHSDVMSARQCGWGMLFAGSLQEVHDFALISQASSLESRIPFLHAFDGFRTSHEVMKIEELPDDVLRAMISEDRIREHRARALSPDRPVIRGTAQNPDVFFQARETVNPFYVKCPGIVRQVMDKFGKLTGRQYNLFDYFGSPDAERIIILMGSGAEAAHETVKFLSATGEKVGIVKVRLFRPFSIEDFLKSLPKTTKKIAVLDRTKEPGGVGEPLYLDVISAITEGITAGNSPFKSLPTIVGGRYGLSSKEFTSAMVKAVLDELKSDRPKNHFTIGIDDDVSRTSLPYDTSFCSEDDKVFRCLFYGLGSDGTVGANKNSIKIIGEDPRFYAQGYFVYDSKKAGSMTVSHLRFGPDPIRSTYLISTANFVACHNPAFLERIDMLEKALPGGTFLLNSPVGPDKVWDTLPRETQEHIIKRKVKFFTIDAFKVAKETGMGTRINSIMQTAFFQLSGILPPDEAIAAIKGAIKKTYGKKGDAIVQMNYKSVDMTIMNLHEVKVPGKVTSNFNLKPAVPSNAPEYVKNVLGKIMIGKGDELPVSAFPCDGTFPLSTTRWEKRNIALEIPIWNPDICIQCNKCIMVCPHATIRSKIMPKSALTRNQPTAFRSVGIKSTAFMEGADKEWIFTLQVAPEDCTGCTLCVDVCPGKKKEDPNIKALTMKPLAENRDVEAKNWEYFLTLPLPDRRNVKINSVIGSQYLEPLFEFSGACTGCGETPYVKLLTQLFGDRAIIANATGCSSIYGGNLPTTPYCANASGRGPAWCNSLFEDNAEFGLGFRLTIDKHRELAVETMERMRSEVGDELVNSLLANTRQKDEKSIFDQRNNVTELKKRLQKLSTSDAKNLLSLADSLVRKSVWILGGDGWAYDIGYGGLDHVIASGRNVNILVLDTEVYSNTGGQMSKSTPRGAVAKFAASGKPLAKKDLGLMAMSYGTVYVARIALGSNDSHAVKAFLEAESYDGPSIIIAYSHCIAHGIDMTKGLLQQKRAVDSGYWPLFRFNPDRIKDGKNPLELDSRGPKIPLEEYIYAETRYKMLTKSRPELAKRLLEEAREDMRTRWHTYQQVAAMPLPQPTVGDTSSGPTTHQIQEGDGQ